MEGQQHLSLNVRIVNVSDIAHVDVLGKRNQMIDLMLDLETIGTCAGAVITQIGAVYFDRSTGQVTVNQNGEDKFLVNVSMASCFKRGLVADAGAIEFWIKQGFNRATWLTQPRELTDALEQFRLFYPDRDIPVWCHLNFDIPLLDDAFKAIGSHSPIMYRNGRDIRTVVDLARLPREKGEEKTHNALDDCLRQIKYVSKCIQSLKKTGWRSV